MADTPTGPGTWFVLIPWGPHPAVAGNPAIDRGLEKIELDATTREQAMLAARACRTRRINKYGPYTAPDGTVYPREPKIVYAEDVPDGPTALPDIPGERYTVMVNYDLCVRDVTITNNVIYVDNRLDNLSSVSGLTGISSAEIHLLQGIGSSTQEILTQFEERGLRPANLWELFALGQFHDDIHPLIVVGLGSKWNDGHTVRFPVLLDGKRACTFFEEIPWSTLYRFAGVRIV